jgi:flagellar basal-body rod protein FlgC
MSTIQRIAQSGLEAAARRLDVSANNVANALTPGFVPSRVDSAEVAGGGVTTSVSRTSDPAAEARADRAVLAASGTDLVTEIVAQSQAAALYQANLAALKTGDELLDATMKLKA